MTGTGDRTALAGIMRLVEQAQSSRSRAQALADRAAFVLTLVALGAGVVTLVAWLALRPGDPAFAVERVVTTRWIANDGSASASVHAMKVATAAPRATSVRMNAARSASACAREREDWACSTRRMMRASAV